MPVSMYNLLHVNIYVYKSCMHIGPNCSGFVCVQSNHMERINEAVYLISLKTEVSLLGLHLADFVMERSFGVNGCVLTTLLQLDRKHGVMTSCGILHIVIVVFHLRSFIMDVVHMYIYIYNT